MRSHLHKNIVRQYKILMCNLPLKVTKAVSEEAWCINDMINE